MWRVLLLKKTLKSNPKPQVPSIGHLQASLHHDGGDGDADQQGGVQDLHEQGGHPGLRQVHHRVPGGASLSSAKSASRGPTLCSNSLLKTHFCIFCHNVYILSAEPKVGGYLGLTLGVSLTDLRTAAIKLVGLWRVERKEKTMFRHWMKSQPFLSFLQKMFFFW